MRDKMRYFGAALAAAFIVATPLGAWAQQTLRLPGLGVVELPSSEQPATAPSQRTPARHELAELDSEEQYTCAEVRWTIGHYAAELHIALSSATSAAFWANSEQLRGDVDLLLNSLPLFVEWAESQMDVCAEESGR